MSEFSGKYWLNFDAARATQPLVYLMTRANPEVVFNIRQASVNEKMGLMAIELSGDRRKVKDAIAWLEEHGVNVEPVEIQTIEG